MMEGLCEARLKKQGHLSIILICGKVVIFQVRAKRWHAC